MDRLANVTPELAKKSAYADDAKAAMEAKKTSLESAKSAFEGAVSAYRAAGAKGQVKEQIDAVIKRLEAFATAAGDDKLDVLEVLAGAGKTAEEAAPTEAAPSETATETPAPPTTAAAPSGEGRPITEAPDVLRQNLEKFASSARNGDVEELRDCAEHVATMDQLLKIWSAPAGGSSRSTRSAPWRAAWVAGR
jgi:hypothetical protein